MDGRRVDRERDTTQIRVDLRNTVNAPKNKEVPTGIKFISPTVPDEIPAGDFAS
jgi:hypothetical protein